MNGKSVEPTNPESITEQVSGKHALDEARRHLTFSRGERSKTHTPLSPAQVPRKALFSQSEAN